MTPDMVTRIRIRLIQVLCNDLHYKVLVSYEDTDPGDHVYMTPTVTRQGWSLPQNCVK